MAAVKHGEAEGCGESGVPKSRDSENDLETPSAGVIPWASQASQPSKPYTHTAVTYPSIYRNKSLPFGPLCKPPRGPGHQVPSPGAAAFSERLSWEGMAGSRVSSGVSYALAPTPEAGTEGKREPHSCRPQTHNSAANLGSSGAEGASDTRAGSARNTCLLPLPTVAGVEVSHISVLGSSW